MIELEKDVARAAFFDLDKTLIPGSSLFLLAAAPTRGTCSGCDLLRFGWGQWMFRLRGEVGKNVEMSRQSTLNFVTGRSQEELLEWGREMRRSGSSRSSTRTS